MNPTTAHDGDHIQHNNHLMPALAEALADPRGTFHQPAEVVTHSLLSPEEKRTILISWARDELMLEHVARGALPELKPNSQIEAVIAALHKIDACAAAEYRAAVASIRARKPPLCSG